MSNDVKMHSDSEWVDLGSASSSPDIEFTAKLQSVGGVSLFSKEPNKGAAAADGHWDEYLLTLEGEARVENLPWLQQVSEETVEFVLILDRSGSMSGQPWSQVQTAMAQIVEMVRGNPKIKTKIMVYNDSAQFLKSTGDSAAIEVKTIRSGGATSFVAVFNLLKGYLKGELDQKEKPGLLKKLLPGSSKEKAPNGDKKNKIFVFFMTDGCDTCSDPKSIMMAKEHLQSAMTAYGEEVIVNVLGFNENHDDAFLESLSLLGTSDGSYSFIHPTDGDLALQQRLTDLLESTTGLVGKSTFLDLKLENEGALFLGEWFGEGKVDIALQAFLVMDGPVARVSTTKFVKIPKGEERDFRMAVKVVKDLREGTEPISATLKATKVFRVEDIMGEEKPKLALRKLRTCLNFITARLSGSVEDAKTASEAEKVTAEARKWFEAVEESNKAIRSDKGDDEEVNKLADAVKSGLQICTELLSEEDPGRSDGYSRCKRRDAHMNYNLKSSMGINVMQTKKRTSGSSGGDRAERSVMQSKQMYMD